MSYTGSTPALGAGRLGSIPSIPTKLIIFCLKRFASCLVIVTAVDNFEFLI